MITRVPFGIELKTGRFRTATEVLSGERCGCTCPECDGALVAKHYRKTNTVDHFAHKAGARKPDCRGGPETALHHWAIDHIAVSKRLRVPAVVAVATIGSALRKMEIQGPENLAFVEVQTGRYLRSATKGGSYPDILATCADGRRLAIDIRVTSRTGPQKLEHHRAQDLPTLEVIFDASDAHRSFDELVRRLQSADRDPREWLYHPQREALIEQWYAEEEKRQEAARMELEAQRRRFEQERVERQEAERARRQQLRGPSETKPYQALPVCEVKGPRRPVEIIPKHLLREECLQVDTLRRNYLNPFKEQHGRWPTNEEYEVHIRALISVLPLSSRSYAKPTSYRRAPEGRQEAPSGTKRNSTAEAYKKAKGE